MASSPSESRWERADAMLELLAEREHGDEESRAMVDAALAEIGRGPPPR